MKKVIRNVVLTVIKSNQLMEEEQIFLILKEEQIDINLSTVYRTLESLENKHLPQLVF